jgi:hypothetical protein
MKHHLIRILALAAIALPLGAPLTTEAQIYWRVSVKLILDVNSNPPFSAVTNSGYFYPINYGSSSEVRRVFNDYNELLGRMGWGYRFDLIEVVNLSGVSQWFNANARDGDTRNQLELAAKTNSVYRYRPDALNLYINNSSSGVSGGHLPLLGDVIFIGANGYWSLVLHEIGHGLGLCHTFGCGCNGCGESGDCDSGTLSDNIADTIRDSPCWPNRDTSAVQNFGKIYSLLTPTQQRQVDDTWSNIMSYNEATNNRLDRFTHDQWERIVDVSNLEKRNITSGKTVFVDRNGQGLSPCQLFSNLTSLVQNLPGPTSWYLNELNAHPPTPEAYFRRTCQNFTIDPPFPDKPPLYPDSWPWPPTLAFPNPPPDYPSDWPWPPIDPQPYQVCLGGYKTLREAIDCGTQNGDRIQIKAGNYNETLRITKPMTLATDRGTVSIGRP